MKRETTVSGFSLLVIAALIMLGASSLDGCIGDGPPTNIDPATGVCNRPTAQAGC